MRRGVRHAAWSKGRVIEGWRIASREQTCTITNPAVSATDIGTNSSTDAANSGKRGVITFTSAERRNVALAADSDGASHWSN